MIDGAYLLAGAHTPHLKRSDIDQPIKRIAQLVWHNMGIGKCNYLHFQKLAFILTITIVCVSLRSIQSSAACLLKTSLYRTAVHQ
jgi:hypothetical protein